MTERAGVRRHRRRQFEQLEARLVLAGADLVVTKVDALVADHNGDDVANPGETLRYTVLIANTGDGQDGSDAQDVVFADDLDSNTTLVPGSTNVSPIAFDDQYTTGTAVFYAGNHLVASGLSITIDDPSQGLFANDREFLGDQFALAEFDTASAQGGSVAVNPDGTFTYTAPPGFAGPDSFGYTISDSQGLTGNGLVQINVVDGVLTDAGQPIHFLHVNDSGVPGTGTFERPFGSLSEADIDTDKPLADVVLVQSGTTFEEQSFALAANQRLLGEGGNQQHLLDTDQLGLIRLPDVAGRTKPRPAMTAVSNGQSISSTLVASDNTEISNFTLEPEVLGILARDVDGTVNVNRTSITTTAPAGVGGVFIDGGSGLFMLSDVHIEDGSFFISTSSADVAFGSTFAPEVGLFGPSSLDYDATSIFLLVNDHSGLFSLSAESTIRGTNTLGMFFDSADGTYNFDGPTTLADGQFGFRIVGRSDGAFRFADLDITNSANEAIVIGGGQAQLAVSSGSRVIHAGFGSTLQVGGGHNGAVTFEAGTTIESTAGDGLQFDDADGTYDFRGTTTLAGGDAGIDILGGSSGSFTFGSDTTISHAAPSQAAVMINGFFNEFGGTFDYNGSVSARGSELLFVNQSALGSAINFNNSGANWLSSTGSASAMANSEGITIFNADGQVSIAAPTTLTNANRGITVDIDSSGTVWFRDTTIIVDDPATIPTPVSVGDHPGTIRFTDLNLTTRGGQGSSFAIGNGASSVGTLIVDGDSNIDADGDAAITLRNIGTVDVTFGTVSSRDPAAVGSAAVIDAVDIDNVSTGTFVIEQVAASGAKSGIEIGHSGANFSFASLDISGTSAEGVSIDELNGVFAAAGGSIVTDASHGVWARAAGAVETCLHLTGLTVTSSGAGIQLDQSGGSTLAVTQVDEVTLSAENNGASVGTSGVVGVLCNGGAGAVFREMGHAPGLKDRYPASDRNDLKDGFPALGEQRLPPAGQANGSPPAVGPTTESVDELIEIGTLPAGKSVTVVFDVTIDRPFPDGVNEVSNQGTVTGSNFDPRLTDDPDTPAADDPTRTTIVPLEAEANLSISVTDSADPVVAGGRVTYTVVVDNLGPDSAENVTVTSVLTPFDAAASSSGCLQDPSGLPICSLGEIAAGGSKQFTVDVEVAAATTGTIANLVTVFANTTDPDGSDNTASEETTVDPPLLPGIGIEKSTNGEDADAPSGPRLEAGSTTSFRYEVVNTGNVPLANVQVTDDAGTVFDSNDDFSPTLVGGDADGDGLLGVNEVWIYAADWEVRPGQHTNQAVATAVDSTGTVTEPVSDQDASNHFGVLVGIDIEKSTNGEDADLPTGPLVPAGSTVEFAYVVTNRGNVALANVEVIDDNGTPGDPDDDFAPLLVDGDANGDGLLDPDETWTFTATREATAGPHRNTALASGDDSTGTVSASAGDLDASNHFGVLVGIGIEKSTNGEDADLPTGPLVAAGSTAEFAYVVTNRGNVALANVEVIDDNGTPGDPDDDFAPLLVDGDANGDGLLDPDETWTFTATREATAGPHRNTALASGDDSTGTVAASASDLDASNHFGVLVGIDIEKSTNGEDADLPTGPLVAAGSTVEFAYVVTNRGNVALANVEVMDDNGTPGDPDDDFSPLLVDGDANDDGQLDPDETWTFTATREATAGPHRNTALASGDDSTGTVSASAGDSDASNHFGVLVGIGIEKSTNGEDADQQPGPVVAAGSTVEFAYVVTNRGNVALANVEVMDDNGTPGDPDDDFSPLLVGGDANSDGLLDPNETWTFTATREATAGPHRNTALASGDDSTGTVSASAGDSDASSHFGVLVGIGIEKSTNGEDADLPTGPLVAAGSTVEFAYVVTNPGNVALASVEVMDDNGTPGDPDDDFSPLLVGGDANSDGLLDPNETWTFTATREATAGPHRNTALASGGDSTGTVSGLVDDRDTSNHFGVQVGIDIKLVGIDFARFNAGEGSDTPSGPFIPAGSTVTFAYFVRNTGNVPLVNIVIVDDNGTPSDADDDFYPAFAEGDANGDGRLDPDETWIYGATREATPGAHRNTATAQGEDSTGTILGPASKFDASSHFGVQIAIDIEKSTNGEDADLPTGPEVPTGSIVSYSYWVANRGNVPLQPVAVLDDNGTPADPGDDFSPIYVGGDENNDGLLDPTEVWSYAATHEALPGQHTSAASASGTDSTGTIDAPTTDIDNSNHFGVGDRVGVKDPGFSYVDANNDQKYDPADGDVALKEGELDDGWFDTRVPEGPNYQTSIASAGLVINGAAISAESIRFEAQGTLVVNTHLTAESEQGQIKLTSRRGNLSLDDPTISAPRTVEMFAAGDVFSRDDVIEATGHGSVVIIRAGGGIRLEGTRVSSRMCTSLLAKADVDVHDSELNEGAILATGPSGQIVVSAWFNVHLAGARLEASKKVSVTATEGHLDAVDTQISAVLHARGKIRLVAGSDLSVDSAILEAAEHIVVEAERITAEASRLSTAAGENSRVTLTAAHDIELANAVLQAGSKINVSSREGRVDLLMADLSIAPSTLGLIRVSADLIDLELATILANRIELIGQQTGTPRLLGGLPLP